MKKDIACGLIAGQVHVPLEGVRIEARLVGACVDVTVTQRYRNQESIPVEAVYVFPLEERAAVCGFSAIVGGKVIEGRIDEREAAFAAYDDAMARGDGAFLVDQERPNVFTASVGNLRPAEVVELRLRYVALASRDGDAMRLTIPTTVSPRYVPKGPAEVGEPDGERVNPPHWSSVPYGLTLKVVVAGEGLTRVECPSHPIRTTLGPSEATVELARDDAALDRDFVLLVESKDTGVPRARVAREQDGRHVAMLTFLPRFAAEAESGNEILFLLDCSGSMGGESIEQARRALSLCVRALRPDDTFNVVRFGSKFESLWKEPRVYDDTSLEEASRYIAHIRADLGGTEILAPLTAMLEAAPDEKRARRVLLLTDGQVSNEDQVLALARAHAGTARIFTFGIGAGASEHLVKGTARASRGAAEMIFPGERIEPKVLRTLTRVRMPAYDDARIDWKGLGVEQAPSRLPPVFAGDALTVFARIESGSTGEVELTVAGSRFAIPIDLERAESEATIPTLWARETILELDDTAMRRGSSQARPEADQRRRSRLVELGKRYGLMSSATSFVAVEERAPGDQVTAPAALRKIPVALTTGWGGAMAAGAVRSRGVVMPMMRMALGAAPMPPPAAAPAPAAAAPPGFFARAKGMILGAREAPGGQSASAPSASSAASDALYDLLMTQRASGSFGMTPELSRFVGETRSAKLAPFLGGADDAAVVTAVVIAVLERDHADREAEWRPAVAKAKAWLAKQTAAFDASAVL